MNLAYGAVETILGGDQVTDWGHSLPGHWSSGYITATRVGWKKTLGCPHGVRFESSFPHSVLADAVYGNETMASAEDAILGHSIEQCIDHENVTTSIGSGVWGIEWIITHALGSWSNPEASSYDLYYPHISFQLLIACCQNSPGQNMPPYGDFVNGTTANQSQTRVFSPDPVQLELSDGTTVIPARSGFVTFCHTTASYLQQCEPLFGDTDDFSDLSLFEMSWSSENATTTFMGDRIIETTCSAISVWDNESSIGDLQTCECRFREELGSRFFTRCSPCVRLGDIYSDGASVPPLMRGFTEEDSLKCLDTDDSYYSVCDQAGNALPPTMPEEWFGEPDPHTETHRTIRWPPIGCQCRTEGMDETCSGCGHGFFLDTTDSFFADGVCSSCRYKMEADPALPNCAWDPPMLGAYLPHSSTSRGREMDLWNAGNNSLHVPPCTHDGDGLDFQPHLAKECVCKPGFIGTLCDVCNGPAYAMHNGTCDKCPDPCPQRSHRDPNDCFSECLCDSPFFGNACVHCNTSLQDPQSVCGPGGTCTGTQESFEFGGSLCTCDPSWHKSAPLPPDVDTDRIVDLRECDECSSNAITVDTGHGIPPEPGFLCVLSDICGLNGGVVAGVDGRRSSDENRCTCQTGFVPIDRNSTFNDTIVSFQNGEFQTTFSGCTNATELCGVGVLLAESADRSTCVCDQEAGFVLVDLVCRPVKELCGPGAISTSSSHAGAVVSPDDIFFGGLCVCDIRRFLPVRNQTRTDWCADCLPGEGRLPNQCLQCSDTCVGKHVVCYGQSFDSKDEAECVCATGFSGDKCDVCAPGFVMDGYGKCVRCPSCGNGTCVPRSFQTTRSIMTPGLNLAAVCECHDGFEHVDPHNPFSSCVERGEAASSSFNGEIASRAALGDGNDPLWTSSSSVGDFVCKPACSGHGRCVGRENLTLTSTLSGVSTGTRLRARMFGVCLCDVGFSGVSCEECDPVVSSNIDGIGCSFCPDLCQGNYVCNGTHCVCPPGWLGEGCSQCDPLHPLGCLSCSCWKESRANNDTGVRCQRFFDITGRDRFREVCDCGPGFVHAARSDVTSSCRPCIRNMEVGRNCRKCPMCDVVSQTCILSDMNHTMCVCRDGWTQLDGFGDISTGGCFPSSSVRLLDVSLYNESVEYSLRLANRIVEEKNTASRALIDLFRLPLFDPKWKRNTDVFAAMTVLGVMMVVGLVFSCGLFPSTISLWRRCYRWE